MLPTLASPSVRLGLAFAALFVLGACEARTDRALYGEGDGGTTHLENGSRETLQVDCTLHLDRVEDGAWVESGEQTIDACRLITLDPLAVDDQLFAPIDAALVFPIEDLDSLTVPPGGQVRSFFSAPSDPGRWRIRYSVGLGCSDAATKVSECSLEHPVVTPAFGVEEFCAPEECVEEQLFCGPIFVLFDDRVLRPAPVAEASLGADIQILTFAPQDDSGIEFFPVPPIIPRPMPIPFPIPTADCRRDLGTQECRWVCDESTPTPPPHGY